MDMTNPMTGGFVASVQAPFKAGETYRGWTPCIDWCSDQFGNIMKSWYYVGEGVFEFKREVDRTAFLLKWS